MSKLVAIDNINHRNIKIDVNKIEAHGATMHLAPAVVAEFVHLATHYPIVLAKNGDTGQFVCSAMLGFQAGENLFWDQDQWQAVYVPLQVRRQPFFLGNDAAKGTAEQTPQYVVCLDIESPSVGDQGERIYHDNGAESDYFQEAKAKLAELLKGESENKAFIDTLLSMDLLESMAIEIKFVNDESTRLNGLYTIKQETLAKLNGAQLSQLHENNYLPAIYAMVISVGQMYSLIDKKNQRLSS
ncbi:MAG: SapC family protein [Colwellia sp.]|nr:SapC family protein [Colwellia sp.]